MGPLGLKDGMMNEAGRWTVITFVTLILHFAWEMGQAGLFVTMQSLPFWTATAICARATFGDLVITAIAFSAAAIAGGMHWPLNRRRRLPALIFLTIGILITIGYEIYALSTGRWAYAEEMPVILGIGLTPLLQWIVIPVVEIAAFRLIWKHARINDPNLASHRCNALKTDTR